MHLFGKWVHLFRKLVHIFGKLVHSSAWKLVSRTSKQVSRNLGPSWQTGVYNDTKFSWQSTGGPGMGCEMALFGGGVAATPLRHTRNCGKSRDRGVATPWSATWGAPGEGVASAPLSSCGIAFVLFWYCKLLLWKFKGNPLLLQRACELSRKLSGSWTTIGTKKHYMHDAIKE